MILMRNEIERIILDAEGRILGEREWAETREREAAEHRAAERECLDLIEQCRIVLDFLANWDAARAAMAEATAALPLGGDVVGELRTACSECGLPGMMHAEHIAGGEDQRWLYLCSVRGTPRLLCGECARILAEPIF